MNNLEDMNKINIHENPETPNDEQIKDLNGEDDGLEKLRDLNDKIQENQAKIDAANAEWGAKVKAAIDAMPKTEKPEDGNTNWITNEIKGIVDDIDANSTGVMDKLSTIKDIINQTKNVDTGQSILAKAKIGLLVEALKKSAVSSLDEKINEVKAIPGVDVEKKGPGSGIHLELQSTMAGKLIDDLETMKNEIEKM